MGITRETVSCFFNLLLEEFKKKSFVQKVCRMIFFTGQVFDLLRDVMKNIFPFMYVLFNNIYITLFENTELLNEVYFQTGRLATLFSRYIQAKKSRTKEQMFKKQYIRKEYNMFVVSCPGIFFVFSTFVNLKKYLN